MTTKKTFKDEILETVDGNIIKDNKELIKLEFTSKKATKAQKRPGFSWGLFASGMTVAAACAVVIPLALRGNQPTTNAIDLVPQSVANQVNDLSFGIGSMSGILTSINSKPNASKLSAARFDGGPHGPEEFGPEEHKEEDLLTPLNAMYSLVSPYLTTVDALLNGSEFVYQVEASGDTTYPYKLGNFIFNIIENTEEEGEIDEPEEGEDTDGDITDDDQMIDSVVTNRHRGYRDDPIGDGEGEGEHVDDPIDEGGDTEPSEDEENINFNFIDEYYEIVGKLIIDEETSYDVNGVQITYGYTFECDEMSDEAKYSELYLNVNTDETHEITVYKSTYSETYSNTFRDDTEFSMEYVEETYAYIESELVTTTNWRDEEVVKRDITTAVKIDTAKDTTSIGEDSREKTMVYLSIESSYIDEETETENTIEADLSFRLPRTTEDHHDHCFTIKDADVGEPTEGEPTEGGPEEGEPTEEPEEVEPSKAFRVDYDLKVIDNTPYEREDGFGHGQPGHEWGGHRGMDGPGHSQYKSIYGMFYMYKDAEGNLLDPDFSTNGTHQSMSNGGYNHDWYDNWDW